MRSELILYDGSVARDGFSFQFGEGLRAKKFIGGTN
jgi:hypothetical protein